MEFANVNFMQPLPSEEISPETETVWKNLWRNIVPWGKGQSRGETTKDKAGALPPAVYTKQQDFNKVDLMVGLENDFNTENPVVSTREEEEECVQAPGGGDGYSIKFYKRRLRPEVQTLTL